MATKRKTDQHSEHPPHQPHGTQAAEPEMPEPEAPGLDASEPSAGETETAPAETATAADGAPAGEPDRNTEELVSQLEEARDRHLRLAADFDNFKKRARQEQLDTMRYAAATVAERLLPVR